MLNTRLFPTVRKGSPAARGVTTPRHGIAVDGGGSEGSFEAQDQVSCVFIVVVIVSTRYEAIQVAAVRFWGGREGHAQASARGVVAPQRRRAAALRALSSIASSVCRALDSACVVLPFFSGRRLLLVPVAAGLRRRSRDHAQGRAQVEPRAGVCQRACAEAQNRIPTSPASLAGRDSRRRVSAIEALLVHRHQTPQQL